MTYGPLFPMDLVGLDVIFAIEGVYFLEPNDPCDEPPLALKEKIARGELGVRASMSFYTYPDPECAREGFLMSKNDPATARTGRQ